MCVKIRYFIHVHDNNQIKYTNVKIRKMEWMNYIIHLKNILTRLLSKTRCTHGINVVRFEEGRPSRNKQNYGSKGKK